MHKNFTLSAKIKCVFWVGSSVKATVFCTKSSPPPSSSLIRRLQFVLVEAVTRPPALGMGERGPFKLPAAFVCSESDPLGCRKSVRTKEGIVLLRSEGAAHCLTLHKQSLLLRLPITMHTLGQTSVWRGGDFFHDPSFLLGSQIQGSYAVI